MKYTCPSCILTQIVIALMLQVQHVLLHHSCKQSLQLASKQCSKLNSFNPNRSLMKRDMNFMILQCSSINSVFYEVIA